MRRDATYFLFRVLLVALLSAGEPVAPGAAPRWSMEDLSRFLALGGDGLTQEEWKAAAEGGVAAKILSRSDRREVVVLGLTRVKANTRCFLTQMEDIETFKKSSAVVRVRKLPMPPRVGDLDAIRLSADEVAGIRACRPGACDLKLPSEAMQRIAAEAERAGGMSAQATEAAFRRWLLDYLRNYLKHGNDALVEYHSGRDPVRMVGELREMLDAKPSLSVFVPEFYAHLAKYPEAHAPGFRGFLYLSTEDFGLKPVTSVTHVHIFEQPGQAVIASKQIYANHYYDASLGLTFLVDASADGKPGMYLVYLNRSRIDLLGSWIGGLRRFFLRRRLLNGFKDNLRDVAERVSAACVGVDRNAR